MSDGDRSIHVHGDPLCGLPFDPSCEPQSWIPSVDFVRVFESSVMMTFIPRCCTGGEDSCELWCATTLSQASQECLPLMFACGGANFVSFLSLLC